MQDRMNKKNPDTKAEGTVKEPTNKERREFFKKLGKYAVYAAPFVIATVESEKGYAAPAPPAPAPAPTPVPERPIPSLNQWGIFALIGLLAGAAAKLWKKKEE